MIVTLCHGERAEVVMADSYSGPNDCFGRLHSNGTATFVRREGEPDSAWRRVHGSRSMHMTIRWAEVCDTFDEYADVLDAQGGGA